MSLFFFTFFSLHEHFKILILYFFFLVWRWRLNASSKSSNCGKSNFAFATTLDSRALFLFIEGAVIGALRKSRVEMATFMGQWSKIRGRARCHIFFKKARKEIGPGAEGAFATYMHQTMKIFWINFVLRVFERNSQESESKGFLFHVL